MVDRQEELRARIVHEAPGWYSPIAHLLFPSVFGLSVIVWAGSTLVAPTLVGLATIPLTWLLANASEWRVHKSLLHKRVWFATTLFDRHTPEHHALFTTDTMAVKSRMEWRKVLLPAWAIVLLALAISPITFALARWVGPNVGRLFLATGMAYVVGYEWLHLSYHLPPGHPIARLPFIRRLGAHHAAHHDPKLMTRWNFNVTIPLWDWLRGTIYKVESPAEAA